MQVEQVASNCQAGLQDIHSEDPAAEKLPFSQSTQLVAPSSEENLPTEQMRHEAPPKLGEYVPG